MSRRSAILALLLACFPLVAHGECATVEPSYPARDATVHDARPDIRWAALPGVKAYRIQIESRVPEGEVIERIDARVSDTHFLPPRALGDRRAAVKVLVTADCPETASIAPRTAQFTIDLAPRCPAVQRLTVTSGGKPAAEWARVNGATRYEVETYSAAEPSLIVRRETTRTSADLPRDARPLVVSVRPRCESLVGEAAFALLPGSR